MNCTPNSLMQEAKCFRCIPQGNTSGVITYLMCQWANKGGEPACTFSWAPATEQVGWVDKNGAGLGDLAFFMANADIPSVSTLDFTGSGIITSISCLRELPALTQVNASNNLLTSIDVTGCSLLNNLDVSGNQLTSLDLTGCGALITLTATGNLIGPTIDLSPCPLLVFVYLGTNALTALDLSANTGVSTVHAESNLLTSITVTNCPALADLTAGTNPLAAIDVSGNPNLNNLVTDFCVNLLTLDLSVPVLIATLSTVGCTSLASINVTGALGFLGVNCFNCALNQAALDSFLSQMSGGCQGNAGIMDLSGPGNGKPTGGLGNPDVVLLLAGGWAVTLNP